MFISPCAIFWNDWINSLRLFRLSDRPFPIVHQLVIDDLVMIILLSRNTFTDEKKIMRKIVIRISNLHLTQNSAVTQWQLELPKPVTFTEKQVFAVLRSLKPVFGFITVLLLMSWQQICHVDYEIVMWLFHSKWAPIVGMCITLSWKPHNGAFYGVLWFDKRYILESRECLMSHGICDCGHFSLIQNC